MDLFLVSERTLYRRKRALPSFIVPGKNSFLVSFSRRNSQKKFFSCAFFASDISESSHSAYKSGEVQVVRVSLYNKYFFTGAYFYKTYFCTYVHVHSTCSQSSTKLVICDTLVSQRACSCKRRAHTPQVCAETTVDQLGK